MASGEPRLWNDKLILDDKWRRVPFYATPDNTGIPKPHSYGVEIPVGYFTLAGARAAQWLMLAWSERRHIIGCIETRLVHVEMTWMFAITELGVEDDVLKADASFPRNFKSVPR